MSEYVEKLEKQVAKQRANGRAAFNSGALSLGVGMVFAGPSIVEAFADSRPSLPLLGCAAGALVVSKLSFAQGRAYNEEATARQAVLDQHLLQQEAALPQPIPEIDAI